MKSYEMFNSPYFNGVRPKEFLKETREIYSKKSSVFGVKKSFNKDFERTKNKI